MRKTERGRAGAAKSRGSCLVIAGMVALAAGASCESQSRTTCNVLNVGDCGQNQKCSYLVLADLAPRCHNVAGNKDNDEFCSGFADDCLPGLQCISDPSGQVFVCRRFCATTADCPEGRLCNTVLAGGEMLCSDPQTACEPLAQNCPEGQGCYAAPYGGYRCYTPRPNPALVGEECPFTSACEPGATCALDETSQAGARCQAFCDPDGDGSECEGGQACQPARVPYTFSSCQ